MSRARFAALLVAVPAFVVGCAAPNEQSPPGRASAEEPVAESVQTPSAPVRKLYTADCCMGVVTTVGGEWVEIGPGWKAVPIGGFRQWTDKDRQKPKRIPAEEIPPAGIPDVSVSDVVGSFCPRETHRLSDLQIGDGVKVWVGLSRGGDEWAVQIVIHRRPGGQIPPLYGDRAVGTGHASHLREQAEQDWEEKGVPIPKKYLNPQGRAPWTNPPYPPVAPMPRPVWAEH